MIKFQIKLPSGQDFRRLYDITSRLPCDVDVGRGYTYYDGKSFLGLVALTYGEPLWVIIHSDDNALRERFSEWEIDNKC